MVRAYSILCLAAILVGGASGFPPKTGTFINDTDRSGYGELIIHNDQAMDAVAFLADLKETPLVGVYIRAGDEFTISGINDGTYVIYAVSGEDWDEERGAFSASQGYYRPKGYAEFVTTDELYTIIEVSIPPPTGTFIRDADRSGYGQLIVHNDQREDAVAVLADTNVNPLIVVYIRAWETFNITGINDGTYVVYATSGTGWNSEEGTFSTPNGYYRFGNPQEFVMTEDEYGINYTISEVTLNEVPLGQSAFVPSNFRFPDLA